MSGAKAMRKKLNDEFQINGYWWLPDSKKEVAGILSYKEERIELELFGSLEEDITDKFDKLEIIFGMSDKGESFTLIGAMSTGKSLSFPGYPTESYSMDSFIVGGHFSSKEDSCFHSVEFSPTYLTNWFNKFPLEENHTLKEGTNILKEINISYTPPEMFKVFVPTIDSTIEESYVANFSGNGIENYDIKFKSEIKIKPSEIQDLNWFKEKMHIIKNLFNLFIGHPINFEDITFYGEYDKEMESRKKYKLFFRQKGVKIKGKVNTTDFVINYGDVKESMENIFINWFEKQDKLKTVFNLYFSDFYREIYLETTFLNAVQTLEIYHRKIYNGKYFNEKEYQENAEKLITFINDNITNELRERMIGMVNFGNEYSLSKRLREIFKGFDTETRSHIVGNSRDRDTFIQQLVDTRNYLTHYDLGTKNNVLMGSQEKYYAIQRLRAIITILLFKEIGLGEPTILSRLKDNKYYSYSLSQARSILNKQKEVPS